MLEDLQTDDLNMLQSGASLCQNPEHVLCVPTGNHCAVREKVPKRTEDAKKRRELAPRGGTDSMDLIWGPRAVSLVKISANLEVAAPALAACVIVNDSKKRVGLPDAP